MNTRLLIGLSISSGLEGVDAVAVRVEGAGLNSRLHILKHIRFPLLNALREELRTNPTYERVTSSLADAFVMAIRQLMLKSQLNLRDVLAGGVSTLNLPVDETLPERIVEQTGVTFVTGFATRDRAAGGKGRPLAPAADYLTLRSEDEDRILLHLGAVATVIIMPTGGKITDLTVFDAGPCNRLLDDLVRLGTRQKESLDPGGTRAVQGHCHEVLIEQWNRVEYVSRSLPKFLTPFDFDHAFQTTLFEQAREQGAHLSDLLCSMNHFVARCVGESVRKAMGPRPLPKQIYVSGGGTRNGFLWQLLNQQLAGSHLQRSDEIGLPPLARKANATAGLTALLLDGVSGNLPLLTGAAGGRLIGRLIPGDSHNWAQVCAWMAQQTWEYRQYSRAA